MDKEMKKMLETIISQNNEILYSIRFHDSVRGGWIPSDLSLSLGKGAIDYSGSYVLFRVLNDFRPKVSLELGMGQSTKIIASYGCSHLGCIHRVVEHDENWIDFFTQNFAIPESTEIVKLDIEKENIHINNQSSETWRYINFEQQLSNAKYDFILIDGPYGYNNPVFSRVDSMTLINKKNLNSSFVIMIHDIHRRGEQNTLNLMKEALNKEGFEFYIGSYENTGIIVSKNNKFLLTL